MTQPSIPNQGKIAAQSLDRTAPTSGLVPFAMRATIVAIVIVGAISAFLPDLQSLKQILRGEVKRALQNEAVRIRLTGIVTNNPAVHWRMSLIEESRGNFDLAVTEIELAIGLLELHSASKVVIDRYAGRLKELKEKSSVRLPSAGG